MEENHHIPSIRPALLERRWDCAPNVLRSRSLSIAF